MHHPHRSLRVALTAALAATVAGAPRGQDPEIFEILAANRLSPWLVRGPFAGGGDGEVLTGLAHAFVAEGARSLDALQPTGGAAGDEDGAGWRSAPEDEPMPDGKVNLLGWTGAGNWDTVYLARTITATADHEAVLAVGFDDSAALWVNGEELLRVAADQAVSVGQHRVTAKLKKGDNLVLFKVVNRRGAMGFAFEISDQLDAGNRWGAGTPDDDQTAYSLEDVPVPDALRLEVGGLLFTERGSLLVCCRRGQIYEIHNPGAETAEALRITTFAEGLHEPLGMLFDEDGSLLVAQKPELTRLRDTDGDGRADEYSTLTAPWGMSGNYHEYHFGPVRDGNGDLWGTLNIGFPSGDGDDRLYRGSAYRWTADGGFHITSYGLRSPNGVMTYAGDVFYTDNQGEWMDVCRLAHLQPNKFYGHVVPVQWAEKMTDFGWETERTLPAVWYPYHLVRSVSEPVVDDTGGAFGPYSGQIFVGDQNNSLLVRTTLQVVDGVYQGACYPFWQGFAGGVNRLAFDSDGVLYVGFTNRGWGSVASQPHGLQRLRYTGGAPFDLHEVRATAEGFSVHFTEPLAADVPLSPAAVRVREYGYRYWSTYGSDEFDSRTIEIERVVVGDDRRTVELHTGERETGKVFHITFLGTVRSATGRKPITKEAFYTLLRIPKE